MSSLSFSILREGKLPRPTKDAPLTDFGLGGTSGLRMMGVFSDRSSDVTEMEGGLEKSRDCWLPKLEDNLLDERDPMEEVLSSDSFRFGVDFSSWT